MSKIKKSILEAKLNFCKYILFQFTELLTPIAVILYLEYYAQYLLFICNEDFTNNDVVVGAHLVLEKLNDDFFFNVIKARNALAHCDKVNALKHVKLLSEFDFDDIPEGTLNMEMFRIHKPLRYVDWGAVMSFIEKG